MNDPDKFITGDSPGACLKQLREEQDLSIQEVATQLFLEPRIIEALESDDYSMLPAATYVKGYLRSYAKVLKVSADPILDLYEDYEPEPPEIIPEVKLKTQQTSSRDKPMLAFSYLIVFVLVLLLFAWWRSNFVLDTNSISDFFGSEPEQPEPPSLSYEIPVVKHPDATFYSAPVTEELLQMDEEISLLEETREQVSEATTTQELIDERGSGPDTVEINLNADSWVEVFDANNEKVYLNLARAGQTLLLHGSSPFTVLLGFSQGATVKFNGQNFDHAPFSRAGIARFSLGE